MKGLMVSLAMVCLTLGFCMFAQAADSSLILYYNFEDGQGTTVKDVSGNNGNGTDQGAAKWVQGKLGKGLELDGTNFILGPESDKYRILDAITLACWVEPKAFDPVFNAVIDRWEWATGNNRCYEIDVMPAKVEFDISSDGTDAGTFSAITKDPVDLDKWSNIVGTFDGSVIKVYINGEEVGSGNSKGKIVAGVGPVTIGDNNKGINKDYRFVGVIDEVAIYNRALNKTEIAQKMTSGHVAPVESAGKLATTWGATKSQY
jgi:hypothetical protein